MIRDALHVISKVVYRNDFLFHLMLRHCCANSYKPVMFLPDLIQALTHCMYKFQSGVRGATGRVVVLVVLRGSEIGDNEHCNYGDSTTQ